MTTTTDTLTRWIELWKQDETLQPEGTYVTHNSDGLPFLMYGRNECGGMGIGPIADMAIRDSAVRWLLARNHGRSYVHIDSNAGDPLPPIVIRSVGCMNKPGDTLDDALYAACKAVLGEEKT